MSFVAHTAKSEFHSGLKRYLHEIRHFPLLSAADEFLAAQRWREHSDAVAAHRLVTSHLRLVAKLALGYRGYGLPVEEIISEGNLGLMQAVKHFQPEKGFRLSTYAVWWIRAAMQEYILRTKSVVKLGTTSTQKKLFFALRKTKATVSALGDGDMSPSQVEQVAARLGVPGRDVIEMDRRLGGDLSLNAPVLDEGDIWQDRLIDDAPNQEGVLADQQEADLRRRALVEALATLNERERRIFVVRHLAEEPTKLRELADELGLSPERVRQIERKAFQKIRSVVTHHVAVMKASEVALAF